MKRVMMVGSAEQSGGGVSSVIRLIRKMPVWEEYSCYWLGTQIQRNYLWKLWYALKANFIAIFIIWRYDIIHIHTVPDKPGLVIQLPVMLLALLSRKKVIVHIHMGNQLKDHTGNGFFRWYLEKADRVVILAECFRDIIVSGYGIASEKVAVVYNAADEHVDSGSACEHDGSDCEHDGSDCDDDGSASDDDGSDCDDDGSDCDFSLTKSKCNGDTNARQRSKTIIMAGYFDENKAPDILMKSLSLILSRESGSQGHGSQGQAPNVPRDSGSLGTCPHAPLDGWRVILMGNGNVEKYKGICHDLGLDEVVSFPGYVTGAEKEAIWSTASIFCLCSHVEGFPMVVLEAWNYGIPVITTPVGGLPDVIEEGRNCLTFDFDDVEGLARQLTRLMGDERLRLEMGEYERKFVREHFSIDTVNKQLEELYSPTPTPPQGEGES